MINIQNVSKVYKKSGENEVRALNDVSLEIKKGDFVAIVGPSGSGKSTMMNILGLLDKPNSGTYHLDNKEVSKLSVNELAKLRNSKIGFVFQMFHLLPRTNAKENVELPLIYSDKTNIKGLAKDALTAVGLEDRMTHFPSEMSGGQQQRVAIARALINDPEIILADEPTGNLDSKAGSEILNIFQELNKKGRTIIFITHDRNSAKYANRIINIVDGKIVKVEENLN